MSATIHDAVSSVACLSWRAAGALTIPLGITDRPLEQRRENLTISLAGAAGHLAVVGGPRSGKSGALRTALLALALTHTPVELGVHVLDFGGGGGMHAPV